MKSGNETEIKLEVRNRSALKRRLARLKFRPVEPRRFERNTLFDFADLRLRKSRSLLRLRAVDGRTILTFKGAPLPGRRYKIRREIETNVGDGELLREIFRKLGLRECFRYEKYRTVYSRRGASRRTRGPSLTLDETPIGTYVELEGPQRWIDRTAHELGYRPRDYITRSYVALFVERSRKRGEQPSDMVFRAAPKSRLG